MTETPPRPAVFLPAGTDPAEASEDGTRRVRVLAGARRRTASRLIDYFAVVVVWTAALALPLLISASTPDAASGVLLAVVAVTPVLTGTAGWYFLRVGRLARWGCTVGQRIAGTRVVTLDGVSNPSRRQAWKRWQPTWGDNSSPSGPWDDYFAWKGSSGRRARAGQCLHDLNAGTVVVLVGNVPGERARRILLGAALAVAALVAVAAFSWGSAQISR
ncbi:RDD family protein [Spirillospora sp. NPDC029432]|uniref:RDD family protein n=1 Tax=Spirillospora sp. NPDC029432 TaxID=3154599 RepID=UPI0034549752